MAIIELKGKLYSITDEESVGAKGTKKFELILKSTSSYMEEIFETWYAIQVFPKEGKNLRDSFLHYGDTVVKIKCKVSSNRWEKGDRVGWATNLTFKKIEKVENVYSKKVESTEKSAMQPMFDDQKEKEERLRKQEALESQEENVIKPIEGDSDDLPF